MKTPKGIALLPLILLVAALPSLMAQQPASGKPRQPLWKIEGKRATVYLLGSIHVLKQEHYPLPAPLNVAFSKAKIAVFETDMSTDENPELQEKLIAKCNLPEGETLKSCLPVNLYRRLLLNFDKVGLPFESMERLKPAMAAFIMVYREAKRLGFDEKLGVDWHFADRARKDGKEIVALETAEAQMDLVTGLSKLEGERFLECMLKDMETLNEKLAQCLKSWQTGNMKDVAILVNDSIREYPELYKRFVVDRNRRWVPVIEKLVHGAKDAIVIVGTGHLAGKLSVIEMLEKNGLKVTQQ